MEGLWFKEETHQYFLDGKELISVTTLMKKHGLAPNYANVDKEFLERKARRGTIIHEEISNLIKNDEDTMFCKEVVEFDEYMQTNHMKEIKSEFMVHNDVCAGCVDLFFTQNGKKIIADIKTTSTIHKDAVAWQLSIYNFLNEEKADMGQCFHFDPQGDLRVVDIPFKPIEEVARLLQCERDGLEFKQELGIPSYQMDMVEEAQSIIERADAMKKQGEAMMAEVREGIMEAMEKNGIKQFKNDFVTITYIAPSTRTTIDSALLKKEMPEVATKYSKTSLTKASLRITLKKEAEGGNKD